MNIKTLRRDLLRLKKKKKWSWEEMMMEFVRVMGKSGPVTTTLYRYGTGEVGKPQPLVMEYLQEALERVEKEG